jgi:hypothetical protein
MDLPPSHPQQQQSPQHLDNQHPSQNAYYQYSYPHSPSPASSAAAAAADYQRATAVNTAANSNSRSRFEDDTANSYNHSLVAPQAQNPHQVGRFTEEWNASQRGSSIVDGHHPPPSNMQRTPSVHSFNAGDDQQLPSRSNTLKKKNSLRRNGSLKRSSSRRSMRAGSVKSLALQSTSDPDEAHSAFHCPVPISGNPTDVLANRFQCSFTPSAGVLLPHYKPMR